MTEENKSVKNFPNLRFPGFEKEWKINRLKDVVKNISSGKSKNGTPQGEYPFFGSTGIISYSNQSDYSGEKILIARVGANAGFIYKVKGNYAVSDNALVLDINNEKSLDFIFYYLLKFNLNKLIFGSGQPLITGGQLKSIEIALPSVEEQNKVSTFLSFIEDRIQTQKKIIEGLQTSKLSFSNKIFTQKLRFKDSNGKTFPDWSYKTLGEVGEIINGLTYSPNDINESGVLVLRSSNVHNRTLVLNDNIFVKAINFNAVKENDILICVRNGSKNLIGKNTIIKKENEGLAFGAFMSVYRSDYNKFIYQWFETNDYKEIVKKNLGATINSINGSDLKKFKIPFPSLEEQKKIANFLKHLDDKINLEIELLSKYENQKKYLLKNLFV